MNLTLDNFCPDKFWDPNLSWLRRRPELTVCLRETGLIILPNLILFLILPFEFKNIFKNSKNCIEFNVLNIFKFVFSMLGLACNCIVFVDYVFLSTNLNSSINIYGSQWIAVLLKISSFTILFLVFNYHRLHGIISSGFTWVFLLINTLSSAVIFIDLNLNLSNYSKLGFINSILTFLSYFCLFVLTNFTDNAIKAGLKPDIQNLKLKTNNPNLDINTIVSPEIYSSFLSKKTFSWINYLVNLGWKSPLTIKTLYPLTSNLSIFTLKKKFYSIFDNLNKSQTKCNNEYSCWFLIKFFYKTNGHSCLKASLNKLISDLLEFVNPLVLSLMIKFVQNKNSFQWHGFMIAFLLFFALLVKSLFENDFLKKACIIPLKLQVFLTDLIYVKSLKLSPAGRKKHTIGEILDLISIDVARLIELVPFIFYLWSIPLKVLISIYFLYQQLGCSIFAGLCFSLILIPINIFLFIKQKQYQVKQMKLKDERNKKLNEMLAGIKIVKFYGWEKIFFKSLVDIRNKEFNWLKRIQILNVHYTFLYGSINIFITIITFFVYIYIDEKNVLTPTKAFVTISLFSVLNQSIVILPYVFSSLVQLFVSLKRIGNFLNVDELQNYIERKQDQEYAVKTIGKVSFRWSISDGNDLTEEDENKFELKNLDFKIKKTSFVAIVGRLGSGKSSLLNCILGEMYSSKSNRKKNLIRIDENLKLAYVPSTPWIQNDTLRNNILFGDDYEEKKYRQVMKCCVLDKDFDVYLGKDKIELGEKGSNLSGGQKQRVNLARACYSNSDVYILDDPLKALDTNIKKSILNKVFDSKNGLLKNKTRILATNQLDILPYVDQIIVLEKGEIVLNGSYEEFKKSQHYFNLDELELNLNLDINSNLNQNEENFNTCNENNMNCEEDKDIRTKLIAEEEVEIGKVSKSNYLVYIKKFGLKMFFLSNLLFVVSSLLSIYSSIYLAKWSVENVTNKNIFEFNKQHLKNYTILNLAMCIFQAAALSIISFAAIDASNQFFQQLTYKILRAPMLFFNITPVGRILNRFTKDLSALENLMPIFVSRSLQLFFITTSSFILIIYKMPYLIFVLLPLSFVYFKIQLYYLMSSIQSKRLNSISNSVIYSYINEVLDGLVCIKTFKKEDEINTIFNRKIDINSKCIYMYFMIGRWLTVRLEFIASLIIFSASILAVFQKDNLDGGTIGLILTYLVSVTTELSFLMQLFSSVENEMISVERINQYCEIDEEDDWEKDVKPSLDWPSKGTIEFRNYCVRYKNNSDLVLKNITFKTGPNQKIGVIGKSGSGKSTFALTLFRIIEPANGQILIDDLDISKIGLHDLRSRISIIPQESILFTGTIRFNLDPFDDYTDEEIWKALEKANLKNFISSFVQGLMYEVIEGGQNLSVGQKQLICLSRAILKNPKILILDEATSSMDYFTDELIQQTIRKEFKNCTIFTIAHRTQTIQDSEKIFLLDKGNLKEYQTFQEILK